MPLGADGLESKDADRSTVKAWQPLYDKELVTTNANKIVIPVEPVITPPLLLLLLLLLLLIPPSFFIDAVVFDIMVINCHSQ